MCTMQTQLDAERLAQGYLAPHADESVRELTEICVVISKVKGVARALYCALCCPCMS